VRLTATDTAVWSAEWDGAGVRLTLMAGAASPRPTVTAARAADLPAAVPPALGEQLGALGTVYRLANPWLWDALTTAILRQVVRAAQARALYERWCTSYGAPRPSMEGALRPVPDPRTVLTLTDDDFAQVGAAFHRTALQAAARAYLDAGESWTRLPAAELADALDAIPRVGPWTARAAAADYTGDYSIYPHGDLAVRTWAGRAAPRTIWPATDRAFAAQWRALADTPHHLHTLTLLTLTWGSHAHPAGTDRPEDRAA
jgi:DNA-3-methyladenine glycosylase II